MENSKDKCKIARCKANDELIGKRSYKKRFSITSKLEAGYSPYYPHARAMGFKSDFDLYIGHLVQKSYVYKGELYSALDGLIESGYDIILPKKLADKNLNQ